MACARTSVLAFAALAVFGLAVPLQALAQDKPSAFRDASFLRLNPPKSYLGLTLGRGHYESSCSGTVLVCEPGNPTAKLYAGTPLSPNWAAELSYFDLGRLPRNGAESRAQGLNLSVVGRARVLPSLGVFGRVGTTYGRTDTTTSLASAAPVGAEQGFGLSYGGGVSYDFTPRLSGVVEWESHDLRFAGGARDPVRSTNLGLQYRY